MIVPGSANALMLGGNQSYQISRSVRLRSSASASFSRTPGVAGNRKTWTWSAWVKRGNLGSILMLLDVNGGIGGARGDIAFTSSDTLQVEFNSGGSAWDTTLITTQVFRDPSAWYHIVVALDTTQATSTNRLKIYVNGVQVTAFGTATYPAQNVDQPFSQTATHYIGRISNGGNYLDGYLTEINFIDGQALTPSSFGQNDLITGVWTPKKYAGTYGTNGFYLNFSDNSAATAAAIGKDLSGNGNNWTPNNISVTAGVTYDSMIDTPTPYADGGTGRGNYAVLNPLNRAGSQNSVTNGNLTFSGALGTQDRVYGTMGMDSGKWYWEVVVTSFSPSGNAYLLVGVSRATTPSTTAYDGTALCYLGGNDGTVSGYKSNRNTLSNSAYGAAYGLNDVIGVALDMDNGTLTFYKNGVSQGVAFSSINSTYPGTYFPIIWNDGTAPNATYQANFGQRPFSYTPPTGFLALNTQNLPTPTIKKGNAWFDASLYTGTGSALSVTNGGNFQPDLVWVKGRSQPYSHGLFDSARGARIVLQSNSTAAEATESAGTSLTSFDSSGFSLGTNGSSVSTNVAGQTFVGWQWKKGATPGFDIVTYTGTGANRTVAHSLGVAPSMMIIKDRTSGSRTASQWPVYHASVGNTKALFLNVTDAAFADSTYWQNTSPTSSVFSLGTWGGANYSGDNYVAYLFAEVAGFSKFGSYTGNGSADGPFVYCGFRPRWVMIKRTDSTGSWYVLDTSRDPYNIAGNELVPNTSNAEATGQNDLDFLSNGFKLRVGTGAFNTNGATMIFAAFASNPFKYSLGA